MEEPQEEGDTQGRLENGLRERRAAGGSRSRAAAREGVEGRERAVKNGNNFCRLRKLYGEL